MKGCPHCVTMKNSLNENNIAGAFAWLEQPQLAWPQISAALIKKQIDEVTLFDFPKGKVRERILTVKDLYKKTWVFWKKSEPLTWKEITQ